MLSVLRRPEPLAATPDDVGSGFLGGGPTFGRAYRRGVPQRVVPRAPTYLRLDRLQTAKPGGRHAMVAVGEEHPFWGRKDNNGRQGVDHPGVALHPLGVEVRLRVDRSVGEESVYPQHRHATIFAAEPGTRNPVAVAIHPSAWKEGGR